MINMWRLKIGNDIVEHHLANWADWHKHSSNGLGYPTKAAVAMGGGQSVSGVFEELCEDADRCSSEIVEALVNDLAQDQKNAIYHRWLGCVIRVRDQVKSLADAYDVLAVKISSRGLI